jgi:hypothetical protein
LNLHEILAEWETDNQIERTELISASLNTPKHHAKYSRIYVGEKVRLFGLLNDLKILKRDKYEHYVDGPHSETPPEWYVPEKGRIIKADVERYLDSDKELLELGLRVDMQREKVALLESILRAISTRNFIIKNAQEMIKFENGG